MKAADKAKKKKLLQKKEAVNATRKYDQTLTCNFECSFSYGIDIQEVAGMGRAGVA